MVENKGILHTPILLITALLAPLASVSFTSAKPASASPASASIEVATSDGEVTNPEITVKFNPTEDVEVYEEKPNSNYGGDDRIGVRTYAPARNHRSYLKFDISSIPPDAMITSARLWVYQYYVGNYLAGVSDAQIKKVDNDAWDEMVVTWNDQPDDSLMPGALIGTINTQYDNQWKSLDVTAYVQEQFAKDKLVSFGMKAVIENYDTTWRNAYFRSKEWWGEDKWENLIVTYQLPAETVEVVISPDNLRDVPKATRKFGVTVTNYTGSTYTYDLENSDTVLS